VMLVVGSGQHDWTAGLSVQQTNGWNGGKGLPLPHCHCAAHRTLCCAVPVSSKWLTMIALPLSLLCLDSLSSLWS